MYTQHGQARCQQRGISSEILDVIVRYGNARQRHGAQVYFMDHAARQRLAGELGRRSFARVADRLNRYVVVSDDGKVITAAPRKRRLKF